MRKRKDEILVNYEGEPYYNLATDEWLIDFEPKLKEEFKQIIKTGEDGKRACSLVAVRNMTYSTILGFKDITCVNPSYFTYISYVNDESTRLPYCRGDMEFLFYRLGQLMTKHENIPSVQRYKIAIIAADYMEMTGIDLIEEMGDIFLIKSTDLEKQWEHFWKSGCTSYFKICKIFKSELMRKITYRIIKRVRWLDICISTS